VTRVLILKTAALGDVLRTTSVLPGLAELHPDLELTWVTAPAAVELVERHPQVRRVVPCDLEDPAPAGARLRGVRWDWLLSLDDEERSCELASSLESARLSGAYLDPEGRRAYTPDVAPWFDMGLLSVHGKAAADRMKVENRRSHAEICAAMLGVRPGRPELPLSDAALAFAAGFARESGLEGTLIGLNTGAGGRWETKELPVERTVELVALVQRGLGGRATFVVLGGPEERDRNRAIVAAARALPGRPRVVDGRTDNTIPEFAALVSRCAVLVTSDSLALHVAVARRIPVAAFFAPTSAAEIELYGAGEKVLSTAPDYCSYRRDADNSTITAERVAAAVLRVLRASREGG